MGTITIVELNSVGGQGAVDGSPVINLSAVIKTTVDSTTSTTAESITLDPDTRYVIITADSLHRLSVKTSDVTSRYITVSDAGAVDLAVNKSDRTLYYRTDA
jgi:hypothetical protein